MFRRHEETYEIRKDAVSRILADEANPLRRIACVIPAGSKVLDIGAGNGLLALVLREARGDVVIDGIEPDPHAAGLVGPNYRNFLVGPAQGFLEEIRAGDYDYVVLADVLEHLGDPLGFLRDLVGCLSERVRIVVSVPNVAFASVRLAMLNGEFDYVDSGLLERTHLRFFTLKTIRALVAGAGLNIEKLQYLRRDIFKTEIPVARRPFGFFCYAKVEKDFLSSVYQFLLVLTKVPCRTEVETYGDAVRHPYLRYLLGTGGS